MRLCKSDAIADKIIAKDRIYDSFSLSINMEE